MYCSNAENTIVSKSFKFAVRTVNLYRYLVEEIRKFILSKQMLRSGTSIGANIKEAIRGQSKADFIAKMNISLKEASETEYRIELMSETNILTKEESDSIMCDCAELIKLLTSIVKGCKNNA